MQVLRRSLIAAAVERFKGTCMHLLEVNPLIGLADWCISVPHLHMVIRANEAHMLYPALLTARSLTKHTFLLKSSLLKINLRRFCNTPS